MSKVTCLNSNIIVIIALPSIFWACRVWCLYECQVVCLAPGTTLVGKRIWFCSLSSPSGAALRVSVWQ